MNCHRDWPSCWRFIVLFCVLSLMEKFSISFNFHFAGFLKSSLVHWVSEPWISPYRSKTISSHYSCLFHKLSHVLKSYVVISAFRQEANFRLSPAKRYVIWAHTRNFPALRVMLLTNRVIMGVWMGFNGLNTQHYAICSSSSHLRSIMQHLPSVIW